MYWIDEHTVICNGNCGRKLFDGFFKVKHKISDNNWITENVGKKDERHYCPSCSKLTRAWKYKSAHNRVDGRLLTLNYGQFN